MILRRVHSGGGLYVSLERRKGNWIASRTGFSRCQRFNHRSAINASRPSFPGAFHYSSLKRRLESSRFQAPSHPGESGHCRNYLIITSDTGDTREKREKGISILWTGVLRRMVSRILMARLGDRCARRLIRGTEKELLSIAVIAALRFYRQPISIKLSFNY